MPKMLQSIEVLRERNEHLDIFLFPPITQWCSISKVLPVSHSVTVATRLRCGDYFNDHFLT